MPSREHYTQLAVDEIRRYWELFGLQGEWKLQFSFGLPTGVCSECGGDDTRDAAASIDFSPAYRLARIIFHPNLRPERYKITAAHECLHALLYQIDLAIGALKEPARSLLDDKLHATVERLASALTEDQAAFVPEIDADGAPWELDEAKGIVEEKVEDP